MKKSINCILSNGEVIKYHIFISVVVIELSVRCLNTGLEDRLSSDYKQIVIYYNIFSIYYIACMVTKPFHFLYCF